mmetsp:Transcript_22618/g.52741  ORF Transcript_22618/g.52741 Transcript_22618/m.52741 type:complete len:1132 (-) Transcript_22618:73-3468(-)
MPSLGPPKSVWFNGSGSLVEPVETNKAGGGQPNKVTTTRFTLVTWLPKSLFVQFQRAANIYFAFVSILVLIPGLSPYPPYSTVVPFALVLFWTACKDLYEDIRRRQDDDAENFRTCWRYDYAKGEFVEVRWAEVLCGDILCTPCDEAFPADLLLLYTVSGQAFISTVNLDGETNLKERRAVDLCTVVLEELSGQIPVRSHRSVTAFNNADMKDVKASAANLAKFLIEQGFQAQFDEPKAGLTDIGGQAKLSTMTDSMSALLKSNKVSMPFQLQFDNFVPRGCVLRNTPWILSVAAYVGKETKTRLNVTDGPTKISNMQHYLNRCVVGLVLVLICFCIYAAIRSRSEGDHRTALERFLIYWVILYQIVPISLYVAFEVLKLLLGYQINIDKLMIDKRTEKGAQARTADLVEELGQVDFVFSDKTGTLTENEMRFARCCVNGQDLGDFREQADGKADADGGDAKSSSLPDGIKEVRKILQDALDPRRPEVRWFFFCLAVCHSAQVEFEEDQPLYSGSSPDEVAFLEGANKVGVSFVARKRQPQSTNWQINVAGPFGEGNHLFTQLAEIPFSSDRKRMSIVVEYKGPNQNGHNGSRKGELFCITKGADNVISALLEEPFSTDTIAQLEAYSMQGLRTLAVSSKVVDRTFFEQWLPRYNAAQLAGEDREGKVAAVAAEMECQLILAGVSAIEDRLQEGVPETITAIKAAEVRFWVLTGDKMETAVEIVRACKLFTDDMVIAYMVNASSEKQMFEILQAAEKRLASTKNGALVIDGTFAKHCLTQKEARERIYRLAIGSRACVCCRLSPQQKRRLVELVREFNSRAITLAIGDGANDVSMIQGAQVGVGVRGKEGNQAVQASDIAISQFRFLGNLLFCHGRRAYRRVALFLCYYIYKHVVLVMADMIWAHQSTPNKFSGHIAYPEWLSSSFSLFFSTLQVLVIVGFDADVPDQVAMAHPELYIEGLRRIRFNAVIFSLWVLSAIWHGSIAWLVPFIVLDPDRNADEGHDFWVTSVVAFSLVIVFINLRIWLFALNRFAWYTGLVIFVSILAYLIVLLFFGYTEIGKAFQPELWHVPEDVLDTSEDRPALWVLLLTPLAFLVDWVVFSMYHVLRPDPLDRVRWQRRGSSNCAKVVAY